MDAGEVPEETADGVAERMTPVHRATTPASPQMVRSLKATEASWKAMEAEFGMLSGAEVSQRTGMDASQGDYARDQHEQAKLLEVERPGGLTYPGFQIDPHTRAIRPVMADLIGIAAAAGLSQTHLALWLCIPTGYLDGKRPVDLLDKPQSVLAAAEQSFNVYW